MQSVLTTVRVYTMIESIKTGHINQYWGKETSEGFREVLPKKLSPEEQTNKNQQSIKLGKGGGKKGGNIPEVSKNVQKTRAQYVSGEGFLPISAQVTGYLPYNPQKPASTQDFSESRPKKDLHCSFLLADGNILTLFSYSGLLSSSQVANASRILIKSYSMTLMKTIQQDNPLSIQQKCFLTSPT